ncbi:MAG: ATP-dependent DNA helicase RecG [Proteobacteria bacterium]|nr:MAG: ATP-dependent DNA helicase RecG [Pseudomonadota bacterium]
MCFSGQSNGVYSLFPMPLNKLSGIGPALEKRLAAREVKILGDLLFHLPRAYVDDRQIHTIASLEEGVEVRIQGRIVRKTAHGFGRKKQVSIILADETGDITLNFFHAAYMMRDARLQEGRDISVRGTAKFWRHQCQMIHPDWCVAEQFVASVQPVYGSVAGLSGKRLAGFIEQALAMLANDSASPLDDVTNMTLREALCAVHQPQDMNKDWLHKAGQRLKAEELLVYLKLMQAQRRTAACIAPVLDKCLISQKLIASLPFELTSGQKKAWFDIQQDLASGKRMHRLVQGDVGAGKTWVAALAIVTAIEHGLQVALMAPTEVLATQHYQTLSELLEPMGIDVYVLTGSTRAAARRKILSGLADGSIACVVGTHALISDDVFYANLALAIVDEQHRFGVKQRWALTEKKAKSSPAVHLLGMTATPIPRSLAMSVYGDMDLTVMRGMPIGRKPVDTRVLKSNSLSELAKGMQRLLDVGGRIYWIVPRIDEQQDDADVMGVSVAERVDVLQKHFPKAGVLGLHGRMKSKDKQQTLHAFTQGQCRLLVSTTVVEVGVNVAEARLIVIDQADHYGLAQLHQLRGRVGRSHEQGYCMLLPDKDISATGLQRLEMMVKSHDGLELAEKDLQLRGAGDAIGTRQSGDAGFRLLDLSQDMPWVQQWHEHLPDFEVTDAMIQFWRPLADSID